MLTEAELQAMAERIAAGVGRFSPGTEAYYALSRALGALQDAERDVRRHDDNRGLRRG